MGLYSFLANENMAQIVQFCAHLDTQGKDLSSSPALYMKIPKLKSNGHYPLYVLVSYSSMNVMRHASNCYNIIFNPESNPCNPNPCLNGGWCSRKTAVELSDLTFECNCDGTGYMGKTCERGIVVVPAIPTITQNESYTFEISAKPPTDMRINIHAIGPISVLPDSVTVDNSTSTVRVNVTGYRLGQSNLHYTLTGSPADRFNSPEDSPVFVGPRRRRPDETNVYFRSVKNNIGLLNESCCMSKFSYPECPMTTGAVTFLSTCSWTISNKMFTTNGIVFTRFKMLSVPLSISGIEIQYNKGTITTTLPKSSKCTSCEANHMKDVTQDQPKVPEEFKNCYFYNFQPEDIADLLSSYALATTYINRIRPLLPSWIGLQLLEPASTVAPSFSDGDFSTSLVEQEGVSHIEGCESLQPDNPGLYSVLKYSGNRPLEIRINEEIQRHNTSKRTTCMAINLCQEMQSPLYIQLPQSVQDTIFKFAILDPYEEVRWSYSLDTVTFHSTKKSIKIGSLYWNGTQMYIPHFPGTDMEIGTFAYPSFTSSKEGYVRIKAAPFGGLGVLSLNVDNTEVSMSSASYSCDYNYFWK